MVNFRGFLRNLPLNTDLMRDFLAEHVFDARDTVDWSADEPALAAVLADAIEAHPDTAVRDDLIAAIEQVAQLADDAGSRQMMGVCSADPEIANAFQNLESPEERALWLYVNIPGKFNEAIVARLFDEGLARDSSQRWTLPACPDLKLDQDSLNAISATVSTFYLKRFGYGRHHKPYVVPRHIEGSILLVIDFSDHACNRARWEHGTLRRGPLILSRTSVLNFHLATGRTETVAPGGAEAQKVLVEAFTEHGLKKKGGALQINRQVYHLDSLLDGVDIFDRETIGIEQPRLKSIAVLDMGSGLRSTFEVMGRGNRASAEKLLKTAYPADKPLKRQWQIVGALIELPFYPEVGRRGANKKTLPLRFNRKGQANLHKFSEAERHLIEPLLVEWGLVDAHKIESRPPMNVMP
ncbi:MAG: hypothetical protein HO274_12255 [Ferrovum myxofaciens]|uniref:hypothetical protein n=1 Tax=Ferrovum myxofaciens TaxID=416213 RepID=UPI0023570B53|nr:hypothetical protein [Ferrovum myxofaciens]QKE41984.1 MAG: hypothetical protein HO274_12255 [Ferrovum myxofaciens]